MSLSCLYAVFLSHANPSPTLQINFFLSSSPIASLIPSVLESPTKIIPEVFFPESCLRLVLSLPARSAILLLAATGIIERSVLLKISSTAYLTLGVLASGSLIYTYLPSPLIPVATT